MTEQTRLGAAIAAVIRSEAAAQKMTNPADLARESGVPYPTLYRYWNEDREFPIWVVQKVAVALGRSVTWVVSEAERRLGERGAQILKSLGATDADVARLTDGDHPIAGSDQDDEDDNVAGSGK